VAKAHIVSVRQVAGSPADRDKEITMTRDLISRRALAILIAGGAAIVGVAGCSTGSGGTAGSPAALSPSASPPSTPASTPSTPPPSSIPIVALKKSKLFYLTKLSKAQLCGLLPGKEPAQILGAPAGPATFENALGLGVVCFWNKSGGSGELYIGISTVFPWRGAQPVDKFLGDKPATVDGHPADAGRPNSKVSYATVHVDTAGPNDPAVEFRAPTLAAALKLAELVMPRLLTIKHAA
jgi:hypothetical protein